VAFQLLVEDIVSGIEKADHRAIGGLLRHRDVTLINYGFSEPETEFNLRTRCQHLLQPF